jgi:hypothetical protein
MEPTARHHEVEERFRRLLEDNELPAPDAVEYEPGTIWLYWHDRKVAIAVDFGADGDGEIQFLMPEAIAS